MTAEQRWQETQVLFDPAVPRETRMLLRTHAEVLIPMTVTPNAPAADPPQRHGLAARLLAAVNSDPPRAAAGRPTVLREAADTALREHGRYLVPPVDLNQSGRVLLGRARAAVFALTHTRLGADGLIDREAHIARLAQQLWELGLGWTALAHPPRRPPDRSHAEGMLPATLASRLANIQDASALSDRVNGLERASRQVVELDRSYGDLCAGRGLGDQDSTLVLDRAERSARLAETAQARLLDLSERVNALIAAAISTG